MHNRFSSIRRAAIGSISAIALGIAATPAQADIRPTFDASELGASIQAGGGAGLVSGATFVTRPPGYKAGASYPNVSPAAVADTALTGFATDVPSYAILSTGDARLADDANTKSNSGVNAGGGHYQGGANYDVTVLRIDVQVPSGDNCLSFDYRFLSEEFPEYVGGNYNDTFIAQLDRQDWYAGAHSVSAPADFASPDEPVGIDNSGAFGVSPGDAAGTTYDAATPLETARTAVTPGSHAIFLTIFDQGDPTYDSVVFVDRLRSSHDAGACSASSTSTGETGAESGEAPAAGASPSQAAGDISSAIRLGKSRVRAGHLRRLRGTARGDVARVQVAIVAIGARAKRGRKVRTQQRGTRMSWRDARGTKAWTLDLSRGLGRGRYTIYSRAVAGNGATEKSFSAASANKVSLTVY